MPFELPPPPVVELCRRQAQIRVMNADKLSNTYLPLAKPPKTTISLKPVFAVVLETEVTVKVRVEVVTIPDIATLVAEPS